jgi:hypothetical protein
MRNGLPVARWGRSMLRPYREGREEFSKGRIFFDFYRLCSRAHFILSHRQESPILE